MLFGKAKLNRRPKAADHIDHWENLIEGMQFSAQEFYVRVEAALAARHVPDLTMIRVGWKEGGPLSSRREYLRLQRERLIFDVCAMPFGAGFYVSEWIGQLPQKLGPVALFLALLIVFNAFTWLTGPHNEFYRAMQGLFGISNTVTTYLLIGFPLLVAAAIIVWFGDRLDDALIRTPLLGFIYERCRLRNISYYRSDQRCAYQIAVHNAVCEVLDEISKRQGIAPLSESQRRPEHRQLLAGIRLRRKP